MSAGERPPEDGETPAEHPEDQEEKGIGLTEEFARLEQEIKREVGGEDEAAEADSEAGPDDSPPGEDDEPSEFGDTGSEEWVAPAPSGETEEWAAETGDERPEEESDSKGESDSEVEASESEEDADASSAEAAAPAVDDIPEEAEAPEEGTAIEHTVVRQGPPPVPVAAYAEPEEDPEIKSPGLWWRFLTASTIIIVAVATATAVSSLVFLTQVAGDLQTIGGVQSRLDQVEPGDPQTILIVGSDKRSDTPGDPGRSDTTMLLRVDPEKEVLSLFSLPRDLKVDIAGTSYGQTKLNEAFTIGGVKKTLATVENLTGLKVNHVVNVDFEGFAKAVDAIGCVYVDVDRHYFNDNSLAVSSLDTYAEINVNPGYQRLCGQNALDYVRYRHEDTDIVRAARQQDFLRNARAQVPVGEILPVIGGDKGSDLIDIFTEYTASDIDNAADLITALNAFIGVRNVPINQISFDGTLGDTYVTATPEQMKKAVDEFLNGQDTPGPTGGKNAVKDESGGGGGGGSKDDKQDQESPSDGANVIPTSEVLDAETGINKFEAFGRTSARRLNFPIYVPTEVVPGSVYSDDSRQYEIKDENDKKQPAYKLVIRYETPDTLPEYYGVQGTTWSDPPILENKSETITSNGRDYDIYYDGDRIRMVAWHDEEGNSYWVSNTLVQTLDNSDMMAIAESVEKAK